MEPARPVAGEITVSAGTPVTHGPRDRVIVDGAGRARMVETANARICRGRHNCAAVYLGAEVVRDGMMIGETLAEPNVVVDEGRIVSLSGQAVVRIAYCAPSGKKAPNDAS
jgi:hypothetical protein